MPTAVPYQWADLEGYGLSVPEAESRVWLVTPEKHFGGASAVTAILRPHADGAAPFLRVGRRAGASRFLGWTLQAPPLSWPSDGSYWVVSRLRHILPGGTPACRR